MLLGIADPALNLRKPSTVRRSGDAGFRPRRGPSIGRADGVDGRSPRQDLAGRPRPLRGKPLVGSRRHARRAVDHVEHQVIQIRDLVHGLGDREPENAVGFAEAART